MSLPEDGTNMDIRGCLLNPLSTIVKLAILGNKPVGTKICIQNNVLSFQEPGPFQSLCRYVFHSNKTDLQYMYNPIQIACSIFLAKQKDGSNKSQKVERLRALFCCAQRLIKEIQTAVELRAIIPKINHGFVSNFFLISTL